eukprot:4714085-Prymnesium_polylepis.1
MAQVVFLAACSSSRYQVEPDRSAAARNEGGIRDHGAKVLSKSISLPVCVCVLRADGTRHADGAR